MERSQEVINGILWVQRTGSPWRDLPESYGSFTTCHGRLLRWQKDGTWPQILQALQAHVEEAGELDSEEGALDASVVKAHQHTAGGPKGPRGLKKGDSSEGGAVEESRGRGR
jgi:transposase